MKSVLGREKERKEKFPNFERRLKLNLDRDLINWFNDCNHFPLDRRLASLTSFSCLFFSGWAGRVKLLSEETVWGETFRWNYYSSHVRASLWFNFGRFSSHHTARWGINKIKRFVSDRTEEMLKILKYSATLSSWTSKLLQASLPIRPNSMNKLFSLAWDIMIYECLPFFITLKATRRKKGHRCRFKSSIFVLGSQFLFDW